MANGLDPVGTYTGTSVGHVQLVIDDGRESDDLGVIIDGTPGDDISTTGSAVVKDQNHENMAKRRTSNALQYLSPASQQKLLEVLDELRVNIASPLLS